MRWIAPRGTKNSTAWRSIAGMMEASAIAGATVKRGDDVPRQTAPEISSGLSVPGGALCLPVVGAFVQPHRAYPAGDSVFLLVPDAVDGAGRLLHRPGLSL